jgi:hypothetical protein
MDDIMIVILYVVDLTITMKNTRMIEEPKAKLHEAFEIID